MGLANVKSVNGNQNRHPKQLVRFGSFCSSFCVSGMGSHIKRKIDQDGPGEHRKVLFKWVYMWRQCMLHAWRDYQDYNQNDKTEIELVPKIHSKRTHLVHAKIKMVRVSEPQGTKLYCTLNNLYKCKWTLVIK